ncbi:MAG TPA: hypothetical protein ENJ31_02405 [Anaerolineae bacterium]|nr:hypothetical protein [Anaerolineae bacterium]
MRKTLWFLIAVLMLAVPLLAACGNGSESTAPPPTATEEARPTAPVLETASPAAENGCLPHEKYDPATDSCYVDISCETEQECDAILSALYQDYPGVQLESWEMAPEDCLPGEQYDPEEAACYIECDTEEECQAKADEIYKGLDVYFDPSFRGDHGQPKTSAVNCEAQDEDEEPPIACYALDQNLDTTPIKVNADGLPQALTDPQRHQEIWLFTRSILPKTILKEETREYHVFTDGPEGTTAYVTRLTDDPNRWLMAIDIIDTPDPVRPEKEFVHSVVHEFGHILTLRNEQVEPDLPVVSGEWQSDAPSPLQQSCQVTYYTGDGCARPESYINLFYQRFWADIYDEAQVINEAQTEEEREELTQAFYEKYRDRFVTEYAATNPGEDLAETFAYFVLKDKPSGDSIADQKVRFLYAFPPLVEMRAQIRGQLARASQKH